MSSSSSSSSDETSASELSTSNCETLNRYSSTNDLNDSSFLKYEKQTSSQVRYHIYFYSKHNSLFIFLSIGNLAYPFRSLAC